MNEKQIEQMNEQFKQMNKKMDEQIRETNERFEQMNQKMDEQFKQMNEKMDEQIRETNERFEQMNKKMDEQIRETNERFEQMNKKMDEQIRKTNEQFKQMNEKMDTGFKETNERIDKLTRKVDRIDEDVQELKTNELYTRREITVLKSSYYLLEKKVEDVYKNQKESVYPILRELKEKATQTDETTRAILKILSDHKKENAKDHKRYDDYIKANKIADSLYDTEYHT